MRICEADAQTEGEALWIDIVLGGSGSFQNKGIKNFRAAFGLRVIKFRHGGVFTPPRGQKEKRGFGAVKPRM